MPSEQRPHVAQPRLRVAILGVGTVGAEVARGFLRSPDRQIGPAGGRMLELVAIADLNVQGAVDRGMPRELMVEDAFAALRRDDVDIVVELLGGDEPARSLIAEALAAGKPVVTANKELLANFGEELFEVAATSGVDLLFEASVAGGIPLIRPLRESLVGERIRRVTGIVNGTTNYVLTRMSEEHCSFGEALAEAQELGYAEADPTADVEGFDAGAKIAILASIAFGARVVAGDVYHEGISGITAADIAFAGQNGFVVKLVAIAEKGGLHQPFVDAAKVWLAHEAQEGVFTVDYIEDTKRSVAEAMPDPV